MILPGVGSYIL